MAEPDPAADRLVALAGFAQVAEVRFVPRFDPPDGIAWYAEASVPGPAAGGLVRVCGTAGHASPAEAMGALSEAVRAFVLYRDGP